MNKVLKFIKNNILVLISLGLNVVVLANTSIGSNAVSYTNNKTVETTVEGSLNELFSAVDINERLGDTSKISGTVSDSIKVNADNISNINTSLSEKQATITGGASTITSSNLTKNRALISNSSGKVAVSDVTSTELLYLDGVTSNIQSQINSVNSSISNINSTTSNHTSQISTINNNLKQNTSGQFILPNGLKICWGEITTKNSNGYIRSIGVNFPVKFNAPPQVFITKKVSASQSSIECHTTVGVGTITTSYAEVKAMNSDGSIGDVSINVGWLAIGY